MISEKCRECPVCRWCEYDPETDTVYPADTSVCALAKKEENQMTEFTKKAIDYLKDVEEAIGKGYDEFIAGSEVLCEEEVQHNIAGMIAAAKGICIMLQAVGTAILTAVDGENPKEKESQEKD